ncbi:hypothetical protein [Pseudorhodoferax sp. Leaf267]|uniref:hypothetical protein n=1 Tax=Pseudorhodoferax sp. Leaf267 TaxID=1736316 RepID=UPI0006F87102|nr:hypothetical protein [Pseudorhodoferax sp. Leaf267]KQP15039.1 hypothetical protein ASF43_13435 [Pseudorhodoferax sp. Leaf267]
MSIATLPAAKAPLIGADAMTDSPPPALHEAARYAVLRRMGSAIRHQIAGSLQPVSMLASLLERRMQAPTPNVEALRKNATEMSGLSRSASSECVALMSWVAPHDGELVAVGEGVEDCLHLLATELSFRGFSVVNAAAGQDALVGRLTLRTLLPAALMALTDNAPGAAQVEVAVQTSPDAVTVSLTLTPIERDEPPGRAKAYRRLTWQDLEALAEDEGVVLRRSDQGVDLVLALQQRPSSEKEAGVRWS